MAVSFFRGYYATNQQNNYQYQCLEAAPIIAQARAIAPDIIRCLTMVFLSSPVLDAIPDYSGALGAMSITAYAPGAAVRIVLLSSQIVRSRTGHGSAANATRIAHGLTR